MLAPASTTASAAPALSVIVPAYRCGPTLQRSLTALRGSLPAAGGWELIVVDDGSPDDTGSIAERLADRVVRLDDGPRGPAAARNRGAAAARGSVLVFVDADVCVAADALGRFEALFAADTGLAAAFGAYDAEPDAPAFVSQYRNLLHHYVHVASAGPAVTFWAGCGAVRATDFHAVGGFDEQRYPRPQIEDVDLGYRLAARGGRIQLVPEIQGTHLKRWTWYGGVVTDVRDRGVPWMLLLLERGEIFASGPLNVRRREKMLAVLTTAALPLGITAVVLRSAALTAGVAALLAIVVTSNLRLLSWFARVRGLAFACGVVPLRLQYYALNAWSAAWAMVIYLARGTGRTHAGDHVLQPVALMSRSAHRRRPGAPTLTLVDGVAASAPPPNDAAIERRVVEAFAPLHMRAFGVATASAAGVALGLVTIASLVVDREHRIPLGLLGLYLHGYEVTLAGALIGAAWASGIGFVGGWFAAFTRNAVLAVVLIVARARLNLLQSTDILDHL